MVSRAPRWFPFTLGGEETLFRSLSGVAAEVIRCGKAGQPGGPGSCHKGLPGPAIWKSPLCNGEPIGVSPADDVEADCSWPREAAPGPIRGVP